MCSYNNFLSSIFITAYHLFRISKDWSMLHHRSLGRVQIKQCNSRFTSIFLASFCCFSSKKLFSSFSFHFSIYLFIFLDEVSNFHNRILTNQKPELVIRHCQCNCKGFYMMGCLHGTFIMKDLIG